jgi:hypothetical protein
MPVIHQVCISISEVVTVPASAANTMVCVKVRWPPLRCGSCLSRTTL